MAKKKRRRRRPRLVNRLVNAGLLALAFWPAIEEAVLRRNPQILIEGYTAGLVKPSGQAGSFSSSIAARWYGPIVAAFILFEIKKMAMRKFKV